MFKLTYQMRGLIDSPDKDAMAALSHIRLNDNNLAGMRNYFESAVAILLLTDTHKKKKGGKRTAVNISAIGADTHPKLTGRSGPSKKKGGFQAQLW